MRRYYCWMLIAAAILCGCEREAPEPNAPSTQPPEASDLSVEAEKPPTPPAPPKHAVIAVVQEFLQAVANRDYGRALALGTPGAFTTQGLTGIHQTFQLDQTAVAQAWVGTQQSAVVTGMIPMNGSTQQAAWGFGLIPADGGQWKIRDADFLPNQDAIDRYLAAFREVDPNAKQIEP